MNSALPFATQQLERRGEFFPYGVALDDAGEVRIIAADPGLGERPESVAVLATMVDGLRRERDRLRAVAIVADVRVSGGDAVRVELEHSEGHAIAVLLPYTKKRFGRGVEFGPLAGASGTSQVWSA